MTDTASPTAPPTTSAAAAPSSTTNNMVNSAAQGAGDNSNSNSKPNENNTNRGLPYYEKLRRELRDTIQKKRLMDKSMSHLEDQIYRFEQSYLEETTAGNIIKGFDNYIKGSSSSTATGTTPGALPSNVARRKGNVTDQDRVFSRSSASFMRDPTPTSSAQTTPSHTATPTSAIGGPGSFPVSGNKGISTNAGENAKASGSTSKNKKKGGGGGGGSLSNKDTSKAAAAAATGEDDDDDYDDEEDEGDIKPPTTKRLKISYGRD